MTKEKQIERNLKLQPAAKKLRRAGNLAEILFWQQVKNKKLGVNFLKQVIIGNCIADFYCAKIKTVFEIDGGSHNEKAEYDAARDEYLRGRGLNVVHFTDVEVKKNLNGVIETVKKLLSV